MLDRFRQYGNLGRFFKLLIILQLFGLASLGWANRSDQPVEFARTGPIDKRFFGMHVASVLTEPWPTVPFASLRIWDSWPHVSWSSLHTGPGTFAWGPLDSLVSQATQRGVELVYTFGYVPGWASSNPTGACEIVTSGSCYPPKLAAWREFVTAVVARYSKQIRYWELWNEPNAAMFWSGRPEDLVAMAEIAYPIIRRAGGTVLTPAPQGMNADQWLRQYFRAGGDRYADVISFHGYLHGSPEGIVTLTRKILAVSKEFGLRDKPLWDTEHSWGNPTWPFGDTPENQSAWLSRFILLSAASGIERSFWYMWDSNEWGSLFDRKRRLELTTAAAYREVQNWIVGKVLACSVNGGLYQCSLSGVNPGVIYWRIAGSSPVRLGPSLRTARNLRGEEIPVMDGQIEIGESPILLR